MRPAVLPQLLHHHRLGLAVNFAQGFSAPVRPVIDLLMPHVLHIDHHRGLHHDFPDGFVRIPAFGHEALRHRHGRLRGLFRADAQADFPHGILVCVGIQPQHILALRQAFAIQVAVPGDPEGAVLHILAAGADERFQILRAVNIHDGPAPAHQASFHKPGLVVVQVQGVRTGQGIEQRLTAPAHRDRDFRLRGAAVLRRHAAMQRIASGDQPLLVFRQAVPAQLVVPRLDRHGQGAVGVVGVRQAQGCLSVKGTCHKDDVFLKAGDFLPDPKGHILRPQG